jgi:hypothetical protein
MSTIQFERFSHPIDFKLYLYENRKKTLRETVKNVIWYALIFFGSTFFLSYFASLSFSAALFNFSFLPLPSFFLNLIYNCMTFLNSYPSWQIFKNVVDLTNNFRIVHKLSPRKKDALIIQSPEVPLPSINLIQLAEKYNLKIFTTSKKEEAKAILNSFSKNSIQIVILSAHGDPDSICLKSEGEMVNKKENSFDRNDFSCEESTSYQWWEGFKCIKKSGTIILFSDSTGKGDTNIAQIISSTVERTVIACKVDMFRSSLESPLVLKNFEDVGIKFLTRKTIPIYSHFSIEIPFFFKKDATVMYKDGERVG